MFTTVLYHLSFQLYFLIILELRRLISAGASGIFAQSCMKQDFSCSTVLGHHCVILLFMTHHTFSIGDRSVLQADHSSTSMQC